MEKTPQQIIEGIRKDRLSGSEGTLGRLSRAVGRLADDLYQKKFHFIMELIQNNPHSKSAHKFVSPILVELEYLLF